MNKKHIKIYIIGLKYSLKFYMQIHKEILNQFLLTEERPIDLIIPNYDRRSLFSLPSDFINIFKWLKKTKPIYIISVGPKVGFLFALASVISDFKLIHWFTGQYWALKKIKIFSLSFIADFCTNLLAYKTICDSKEQAYFLRNNFFIKRVLFDNYGSINYVSKDLYLIGEKRLKKINSLDFRYEYPIKVGFLGRICLEKGLEIIKELSKDIYLKSKFKFFIRGPIDSSISKYDPEFKNNKYFLDANSNIDFNEGFIKNSEFFNAVDIFLLPSKREGFGSVALEAQACAIPVICSDIYGLYSSVIEGYGGIHCKNIDEYKNALKVLEDRSSYKKFCNNAFQFSLNYAGDKFKNNLFQIYKKIILIN